MSKYLWYNIVLNVFRRWVPDSGSAGFYWDKFQTFFKYSKLQKVRVWPWPLGPDIFAKILVWVRVAYPVLCPRNTKKLPKKSRPVIYGGVYKFVKLIKIQFLNKKNFQTIGPNSTKVEMKKKNKSKMKT